ncbi:portal protein [Alicycliphilus denitrificans]|uniref:Portal protein n=1 Tax=Alicycliphilus denitrificans TaxID=179636 RepID=A0A3R7EZ52_9BURK|nr:hypothetical protein [Alicycliphilus denitrificans]RKJ96644.1 hypothetical protein CE154_011515 [Alicycliphilus denitrificans]
MAKMNKDTFRNVLEREIEDAQSWLASGIRGEQQRNLQYYLGLPLGNEVPGRSQVVSWDVFETIEAALPNFLEPFFSGDNIGEFLPRGPEDAAYAEQATELVNYVIRDDNPGFLLFSDWFKDALLSKIGVLRAKWAQPDPVRESFNGLTSEQLVQFVNDSAVTVLEHAASEVLPSDVAQAAGVQAPLLWDVTIQRQQRGRVELCNVPPGDFVVNRGAKRLEDARLIGEWVTYTRSQLKEMGFKNASEIKSYDGASNLLEIDESADIPVGSADKSLEEVKLFEGFIRCDYNGDGVAEWRRVLVSGDDELENEEVDGHEYAILTPIKLPHRVIGMAMADPVIELQRLNSGLTRQYVDSLFLANNPRTYVNMAAKVNLEDVISNRIGGIIRGEGVASDAVAPIKTALVATESLAGLEMVQGMRERRTGVTRYNQGLDADSLNKTATGITKISNMADKRMLLILRSFAETGVKQLFKLVLRLLTQYQDIPTMVRLRGRFVQFDPRMWSADMDVSTDVGLGTGDRAETLMLLQQFGAFMQQAAQVGLVGPEQVYEFGKALAKNAKLKGADEKFMLSPDRIRPKPPPPSPEQIKAQIEQMKLQAEAAEGDKKRAAELQIKQMELQQQHNDRLLELAAGYLAANSRNAGVMGQPTNIIGGTMLDQNIQVPGVTEQDLNNVAQIINGFAQQFQGGAA